MAVQDIRLEAIKLIENIIKSGSVQQLQELVETGFDLKIIIRL